MKNKSSILSTTLGTSLFECCIVLALIACIVGIGITQLRLLDTVQLSTEMHTLFATARYLQQRALTTNIPQKLLFDTDKHSYSYNGTLYTLPPSVRFGYPQGAHGPPWRHTQQLLSLVAFMTIRYSFGQMVSFSSGTIYVVDHKKSAAYALSSAIGTVACLRLYQYKNGIWSKQYD